MNATTATQLEFDLFPEDAKSPAVDLEAVIQARIDAEVERRIAARMETADSRELLAADMRKLRNRILGLVNWRNDASVYMALLSEADPSLATGQILTDTVEFLIATNRAEGDVRSIRREDVANELLSAVARIKRGASA